MSGSLAFLKKEFKEILRTYKIWMVPLIFLFFGFLSPIVVKVLPDLLKPQLEAQKIFIEIPAPTAVDAFLQYFKNLAQIGMLAIILISMGLISEEKTKGTLPLVLAKPVSRSAVVTSKFLAHASLILGSILVGAIGCYLYTTVLFEGANFSKFAQGTVLYLIYSLLTLTITLFFSTLLSNQIAAGGLSLIVYFSLSILPSVNKSFAKYSPHSLTSYANKIVTADVSFSKSYWPVAVLLVFVIFLLTLSSIIFSRQEL